MRLSVTARLALLAIILSLASSFVLIAVIRQQVAGDGLATVQRDTAEEATTYRAVFRAGGAAALRRALANVADGADAAEIAGLYDHEGHLRTGIGPRRLARPPRANGMTRIEPIAASGLWTADAAFVIQRVGGDFLVTGRLLDGRERGERAIERALILALALSVVLGVTAGLIVTRYVTARLGRIADTADRVAAGDLSRRVVVDGGHDAFDRLGGRMNAMLDRLERLMGELRLVTDSLGHDLRSPLARVRGRIESALAQSEPLAREGALVAALAETDGLLRMLATLLEIGRSEATPRDRLTPTDPAALIAEIGEFYAPVAEEAGRPFELIVASGTEPVRLHRELLSQAVGNMIDNALKHGGGLITLQLARTGPELVLTVADHGTGIPESDRDAALSRFGRLDPARSAPGAGLGLALVDAVARLHGGRVVLADAGGGADAPGLAVGLHIPVGTT